MRPAHRMPCCRPHHNPPLRSAQAWASLRFSVADPRRPPQTAAQTPTGFTNAMHANNPHPGHLLRLLNGPTACASNLGQRVRRVCLKHPQLWSRNALLSTFEPALSPDSRNRQIPCPQRYDSSFF
ncbi:hypothetical protein P691DRAFT_84574 [Macrolepiota fuliginosa MF-IS2]|uniref:Uncharacterized protein n=1 Tax=Macrolepiota fuliginosa MF-IS2 TaxID=1400762 RepID=A0A9P5XBF2_9AGAR|nr:hypothetical protein P691DRAFT_84574 [Macrolepiota fuliginosa MF-IS2]